MPARGSMRDKSMASFLRERGVERNSGACPWGCGHLITNGGQHLLIHLNTCKGSPRKVRG
jgi:hypothetical protein